MTGEPAEPHDTEPHDTVRMLGHLDPYLLGYRDRSLALAPDHAPLVQTGGGFLTPHVVVGGRVVAVWRRDGARITVQPFGDRPDIADEVADLGRFLDVDVRITWV